MKDEGKSRLTSGQVATGCLFPLDVGRGARAGEPAEHRAGGEPGAARVVVIEDAAHQLAGGVEPGDGLAGGVLDFALPADLDAAKAEGDAAGDAVGLERRLVNGIRPV